jgi:hypothetical protein
LKAQIEAIAFSLAPRNKPIVIKTFRRQRLCDAGRKLETVGCCRAFFGSNR